MSEQDAGARSRACVLRAHRRGEHWRANLLWRRSSAQAPGSWSGQKVHPVCLRAPVWRPRLIVSASAMSGSMSPSWSAGRGLRRPCLNSRSRHRHRRRTGSADRRPRPRRRRRCVMSSPGPLLFRLPLDTGVVQHTFDDGQRRSTRRVSSSLAAARASFTSRWTRSSCVAMSEHPCSRLRLPTQAQAARRDEWGLQLSWRGRQHGVGCVVVARVRRTQGSKPTETQRIALGFSQCRSQAHRWRPRPQTPSRRPNGSGVGCVSRLTWAEPARVRRRSHLDEAPVMRPAAEGCPISNSSLIRVLLGAASRYLPTPKAPSATASAIARC